MFVDYYEILEVSPDASQEEIRAAISRQRRVWVRRQSSADPERRTAAEQRVRDIDQAEKTLLDPRARSGFDAERQRGQPAPEPSRQEQRRPPTRQPSPAPGSQPFAEETPEHWLDRARSYLRQGNPGAAARAAELATRLDPSNVDAWLLYGLALTDNDLLVDAEVAFAEAVRIDPTNTSARRELGLLHVDQREWRQAANELEYVLRDHPDDVYVRAGLGEAYIHTGRAEPGLAMLERVHAEQPDDEVVKAALANGWYEQAMAGLSEVDAGSPVVLSRRQLALVSRNANKIKALGMSNARIEALEDELRSFSREARKPMWLPSYRKRFYLIPLVLAVMMMAFSTSGGDSTFNQTLGGIVLALVIGTYVLRHRVPSWKVRRKDWSRRITKKGI